MALNIKIYDGAMTLLGILENVSDAYFKRSFFEVGDFAITTNINVEPDNAALLVRKNIVMFNDDVKKSGIITDVTDSISEDGKGSQIRVAKGFELKHIFSWRYVMQLNDITRYYRYYLSAPAETCIKTIVSDQCGAGSSSSYREFPLLSIATDSARGPNFVLNCKYNQLGTTLASVAKNAKIGWYVYLDLVNKLWVLDCSMGLDRTTTQSTNPWAIFSSDRDTLKEASFSDTDADYKNLFYVFGSGAASNRIWHMSYDGGTPPSGIDRREYFSDESSLTTDAELASRGTSLLNQYNQTYTIDGQSYPYSPLVLGTDYNLGDTVNIYIDNRATMYSAQIIEVQEEWQNANYAISLAWGKPVAGLTTALFENVNKANGILAQSELGTNVNASTSLSVSYDLSSASATQLAADVIDNVINLTGSITSNKTFTFYLDTVTLLGNKTYTLTSKVVSSTGAGPYTVTLTTGISGKSTYAITIPASTTISTQIFTINIDAVGNVTTLSAQVIAESAITRTFATSALVLAATANYEGELVFCFQTNSSWQWTTSTGWYDTKAIAPSSPLAIWRNDETPDIPDSAAGVTYLQDAWATTDGFKNALTGGTTGITVSGGRLNFAAGTYGIYRVLATSPAIPDIQGKRLRLKIKIDEAVGTSFFVQANGATILDTKTFILGKEEIFDVLFPAGTAITNFSIVQLNGTFAGSVDWIYIGTGDYSSPSVDNSGNGLHLNLLGGTLPVSNGLQLNGSTAYLKSTIPLSSISDVQCFSIDMPNGHAQQTIEQMIFSYRVASISNGFFDFYRYPNSDTLIVRYCNGSAVGYLTYMGYFTGFSASHIHIIVAVNWANAIKTYTDPNGNVSTIPAYGVMVFRNGTQFGTTQIMTTPVKPLPGAYLYFGSYQGTQYFLNGTLGVLADFDHLPTAPEIRGLNLGILPASSFRLIDWQNQQASTDGVIDPAEKKQTVAPRWLTISEATNGTYIKTRNAALAVSGITASTAEVVALDAAYNALSAYLLTTPGVLIAANMPLSTNVVKATYDALWTTYGGAEVALNAKIVTQQKLNAEATAAADATIKATAYSMRTSVPTMSKVRAGTISPSSITVYAYSVISGVSTSYAGRFKIYEDGVLKYTSSSDESSKAYTPTASISELTFELYEAGGTTVLRGTIKIAVIQSDASAYLGTYVAAHPSSTAPATAYIDGDWWVVKDTDDTPIERGVWYSNAGTPTRISAISGETGYTTDAKLLSRLQAAFADIGKVESDGYGTVADYGITTYFEAIGAVTALVTSIFAQDVNATGTITGAVLKSLEFVESPEYDNRTWANTDGWVGSSATLSVSGGYLIVTRSVGSAYFARYFHLDGGANPHIALRYKQTSGDLITTISIYYTTASHGISSSYYKDVTVSHSLNVLTDIDIDMSSLTAGGTDWMDNTILQVQIYCTPATSIQELQFGIISINNTGKLEASSGIDINGSTGISKLLIGSGYVKGNNVELDNTGLTIWSGSSKSSPSLNDWKIDIRSSELKIYKCKDAGNWSYIIDLAGALFNTDIVNYGTVRSRGILLNEEVSYTSTSATGSTIRSAILSIVGDYYVRNVPYLATGFIRRVNGTDTANNIAAMYITYDGTNTNVAFISSYLGGDVTLTESDSNTYDCRIWLPSPTL